MSMGGASMGGGSGWSAVGQRPVVAGKPGGFQERAQDRGMKAEKPSSDGVGMFRWEATEMVAKESLRSDFFTTVVTRMGRLARPAVQIGFSEDKVSQLLGQYEQMVMQASSPNVLLSTYAWMKLNGLMMVLMAAGVEYGELEARRKQMIKQAIMDNQMKFSENEYNLEMIHILVGSKKTKKVRRSLIKMREELQVQMRKLGKEGWYTEARMVGVQQKQVDQIGLHFRVEADQLETQSTYWYGDHGFEGERIEVRVSDDEIDTYEVLQKKLLRLAGYMRKVNQRWGQLEQKRQRLQKSGRLSSDRMADHLDCLGLRQAGVRR